MADRKLSTDTVAIGAEVLKDLIGYQIAETLHVDKKRFKVLKDPVRKDVKSTDNLVVLQELEFEIKLALYDVHLRQPIHRSTRYLVLSNRWPRRNICGLYCFVDMYSSKAEYAYSTLELQSAKTYEPSDKKGFGLLIMFEKADKSSLKFICPGRKESEKWVEKINEAINEDKNFSQDSAYGSGGSFNGERPKRTSATDFERNQQHVPNYDEIDEETMYQTNKRKDAEDTNRKERTISEKRISSREAKQTAKAEFQDQTSDYENPEEQYYLNENLGKRNHDNDHTRRKERINSRDARPAEASGQQDETYENYYGVWNVAKFKKYFYVI